jgi:hypothetical protein
MAQTVRGKIVVVQKRKRSEARRASETEFVAGWVDALERTVDASRMRLAGDPVLVDLQTGLETYLKACLDHIGDLTLDVENSDLLLEGHCVYHSSSNNSISAALSRDGVRAITLRRGVEPEEIRDLVEILRDSIDGTSQGWDDIVTLLWDRDFRHIAYRCEPCDEWAEPWSAATDEWPEDFNDWAQDAEAGGAAYGDQAAPWTETLEGGFEFTPVEAENVRMVALIEDVVPLRERVLEAVSAMLVAEEEAASFLQCGALIGVLVQRAVGQGNLGEADRLLSRLRSIAAAKTTTPAEFKAAEGTSFAAPQVSAATARRSSCRLSSMYRRRRPAPDSSSWCTPGSLRAGSFASPRRRKASIFSRNGLPQETCARDCKH